MPFQKVEKSIAIGSSKKQNNKQHVRFRVKKIQKDLQNLRKFVEKNFEYESNFANKVESFL